MSAPSMLVERAATAPTRSVAVFHPDTERRPISPHTRQTTVALARRIATLIGGRVSGDAPDGRTYLVPSRTLVAGHGLDGLTIRSEDDLFGGLVPHPFVATKAITHPLVATEAPAPTGWQAGFADHVGDAVSFGFTAFDRASARRAGMEVLARGPARVKRTAADGGRDQFVARDARELDAAIDAAAGPDLPLTGLTIEEDFTETTTLSVGRVLIAGSPASYWGRQRTTPDNRGGTAYGGSTLHVVSGGFEALLSHDLPAAVRAAVQQSRRYDAAADAAYPDLIASRRNYDVLQGRDAHGRQRSVVLEQSWRLGGASSAEIIAVEAFLADPALKAVTAASYEVYGECGPVPAKAVICFAGDDPEVGRLTKYAVIEAETHA